MLGLWKRFCQRISNIQICMYFAYLYLTSPNEFPYEVKLLQYVFAFLVVPWLLSLLNTPIVVTLEVQWTRGIRKHTKLYGNFLIQTPSFAQLEAAMYSASIVESVTVSCLEIFQLTTPPFIVNTKPDCDFNSSRSIWKLASV
jgi:hypothetical protein